MLALKPIPREELLRQSHEQFLAYAKRARQSEPRAVVNLEEARGIDRPVFRAYRGRPYRVDPISYNDGLDLTSLVRRLGTEKDDEALRALYAEAVAYMGRLATPATGWRRWFRALLPNPFRDATEPEVIGWLDFFWKCRTGLTLEQWLAAQDANGRST